MNYPIAISDTGSLSDSLKSFAEKAPAVRVAAGGALGALVMHFLSSKASKESGYNALIGAGIGAAGGYFATSFFK